MSDKYVCGWTEDSFTYYWYSNESKRSFTLDRPIAVDNNSYVCMCPGTFGKMMVVGTGYPPYKDISPVQILQWSDFEESSNTSFQKFLASINRPDERITITLKQNTVFGVSSSILVQDVAGDLCIWGFRQKGWAHVFSCPTADVRFVVKQQLEPCKSNDFALGCFPLKYEDFSAQLVLPLNLENLKSVEDYIESICIRPIDLERIAVFDLWQALSEAGWRYSLRDVVRFHTSVKTGPLTIVAGASGTGKSSLFKHYARFVTGCAKEGKLWKRMNVVSTWMEPSDLLGWKSPLANVNDATEGNDVANDSNGFQPAPGGLQGFLEGIQLQNDKSKTQSLLCFEEMNLAQAELYFSDFLQAISDPPDDRKIPNPKGGDFTISDLRIIGTCNIDHTTKPFTERFLDRCNYIDLSASDTEQTTDEFFPRKLPDDNPSFPKNLLPAYQRPDILDNGVNALIDNLSRNDAEWGANWKTLTGKISELGIFPSWRVSMSMVEYILARPALMDSGDDILEFNKCCVEPEKGILLGLDEALVQRVLPKLLLRGEWDKDDDFWTKISTLNDLCDEKHLNFALSKKFLGNLLMKGSKG